MGNPRVVECKPDAEALFYVRGHVGDQSFHIHVPREAGERFAKAEIEDRLLEEARSLIRLAERDAEFDWSAHRFELSDEFPLWEKTLSRAELARLMQG